MRFTDVLKKKSLSLAGKIAVSLIPPKSFTTLSESEKYMPTGDDKFDCTGGEKWSCGFAKSVLTPTDYTLKTYYIAGYNSDNPVKGVLDDMFARAVYFDDNSGRGGAVFCAIDCVGMSRKDINDIRKLALQSGKLGKIKSINICATHTHSAVDTQGLWGEKIYKSGRDEQYMAYLKQKAADAVVSSYLNRKDGKLFLGIERVEGIQADVRTPVTYDDNLTVLHFVPFDGSEETFAVNFACHAELLGDKTQKISADFPAYLIAQVEKRKSGANVAFFNGAVGGMVSAKDIKKIYRNEIDCEKYTREFGAMLGDAVAAIKNETEIKPVLNIKSKTVKLFADNTVLIFARFLKIINNDIGRTGKIGTACLFSEVSYAEFGEKDVAVFLVPGEIFPEFFNGRFLNAENSANHREVSYKRPLADMTECKHAFVIGLCNDELGYIVPENDFIVHPAMPYINSVKDDMRRNHYEETVGLGPKTGGALLGAFEDIISRAEDF